MISLEEALTSLKEGVLPQPSVEDFARILHKCRKDRDPVLALCLHAYMHKCGLETHTSLGNYLVPMLVEVGGMCDAQQVFDRLVSRYEWSWNSLITGYIKCGKPRHALTLYQEMQKHTSVHPSRHTYVALLKASAKLKDLKVGLEIHADIARTGFLERDLFVGSALVDMYAKGGLLAKAQQVFDKLPIQDVVLWTSLIKGYAEHGHGEEAIKCFEQMQLEGVSPDAATFVCSLKACGSIGAIEKGQQIHAKVTGMGSLERDLFVGSTLVDMYAKCGLLAKAQQVFDRIPVRNVVLWTALIAGYAEHGHGKESIKCFEHMQHEGVFPDAITFVCILKACGSVGATEKGQEIHAEIERQGLLERNLVLGNTLVDMYAKCGLLAQAHQVFDRLPARDIVSWNALIAGYAEHGHGKEAAKCFERMQLEGLSPNAVTLVCILKACGSIGAIGKTQEICAEIERHEWLETNLFVGSALVHMHAKCGLVAKARRVFNKLRVRNLVSWNALIAGYAEHGHGEEALKCFEQMQLEGISPDAVTFVCILKACGGIGAMDKGQEVHAEIERQGLLDRNLVGNTLVDMYAKCGSLAKAQQVFDRLPVRNVVSWTALMAGYAKHGHGEEAVKCFERMQLEGVSPDAFAYIYGLKACGSIGATGKGGEIHAEIERQGLLDRNLVVGNMLVDMYGKCGSLAKAQQVFDKLPVRDTVSWNALIAGYAEDGRGEEAVDCFERMQLEGVSPDAVTLVCSLKACASIGATGKGREIHAEIERRGLLERDLFVGSTLVDMYAKCGLLEKAQQVFGKLPVRDVVSWNALMAGYAQLGDSEYVFHIFDRMLREGIKPDPVTFVVVLSACRCTGLLSKSQKYFEAMSKDYDISPTLEHHTCMVDLLSRAGQLDKAVAIIKKMPFCPNLVVWHTVLGACSKLGSVEFGKQAFEHAVHLDEKNAVAYVLMSHIYAGVDWQEKANKVEAIMKDQS